MSSGNPFGLSEISHYGTMQRVGGKAAGFINKKFFHPSSFRNQEKLWKAQTAHAVEMRKQADMEKRRDEERQVEELRKQMYLAGQAQATDMLSFTPGSEASSSKRSGRTFEQVKSVEEMRRRKALLKQERASQEAGEVGEAKEEAAGDSTEAPAAEDGASASASAAAASSSSGSRAEPGTLVPQATLASLVKSRYTEDRHVRGHSSVWGSWFTREAMKWGFGCCKSTDYALRCPLAPEEDPEEPKAKRQRGEPRGKRKRKGGAGADGGAAGAASSAANGSQAGAGASSSAGGEKSGEAAAAAAAADAGPPGEAAADNGSGVADASGGGGAEDSKAAVEEAAEDAGAGCEGDVAASTSVDGAVDIASAAKS